MDQHLAQLLLGTLSADASIRQQAELDLNDLQKNGDSGLSLTRICLAQDVDLALRQSAGVNLKKYVREHWSIAFEAFKGDPPNEAAKKQIRQAVFAGLSDPLKKIRFVCANVVSEIASSDWPDEWPNLLESLVQLLASEKADGVHGAMRVMTDFVSTDLSEDQLLPLASSILPQLLQILVSEQRYSAVTRSQSVSVFRQCLSTLYMVKDNLPQASQYATNQILPQWIEAFTHVLSSGSPLPGATQELYVKHEIFRTLSTILVSFPKTLSSSMATFIQHATVLLSDLAPVFRATHLNDDLDAGITLDSDEGDSLTLSQVASEAFEFLASASRRPSGKSVFIDSNSKQPSQAFSQIMYLALYFAQITTEDEERWSSDMNAFVADEDEEIPAATLRTATLDLVSGFGTTFGGTALELLGPAVQRVMRDAERLQQQGQADAWKGYEACLAHLSSAADDITENSQESVEAGRPPAFDLGWAFQSLIMPFISRSDLPFLQGRAMIFASTVASQLPQDVQRQFFDSAMSALESTDVSFVIKVSALRALKNFCQQIPDAPAFITLGDKITSNLIPFVAQTSEATLVLILETLQRTLSLGSMQHNQQLCHDFSTALLHPIAAGETRDPVLSTTLSILLDKFASSTSPSVYEALLHTALPRLAAMLHQPETDDTRPQIHSALVGIDSIFDGRPVPFGDNLFSTVAGPLFELLQRTDDDSILQEGLECLTFVIRKDIDQLMQWQSASGDSGIATLFNIVARVLDPKCSESGGLFVGDLLLHVFRRAREHILPILPDLLRALVQRLSTAQTATFSQSLILPFAFLMHSQADTVLSLLESVRSEDRSGVEILLRTWTDYVETFQGFWNIRISTVALSQLLSSQRPSVNSLLVKGDLIVTQANSQAILTRSRSRKNPDQFTQIPFKAKAVKILLKELQQSKEASAPDEAAIDNDGETDDWEDDEEAIKGAIDLTDFMGGDESAFFEDDEDEVDEDLKTDPLYTLNIADHIEASLKNFAQQDKGTFDACVPLLNQAELHTLHSI